MRTLLLSFLVIFIQYLGISQEYQKKNIELISNFKIPGLSSNTYDARYSSCWGYAAHGREYAIVGTTDYTAIVDVTDPTLPKHIGTVESKTKGAIWREYKTLDHYLYIVMDGDSKDGLIIVDLDYLPDSVHVVYSSNSIVQNMHTIFIESEKLYYGGNRKLIDLSNRIEPKLIGNFVDCYTHDMYVRNDTVFSSCGYDGLKISVVENGEYVKKSEMRNYPYSGYNHSSVMSRDGKYLFMLDEVPESLPGKVVDISDLTSPLVVDTFYSQSGSATLHNPFISKHYPERLVVSNYEDGVTIYDITDPLDMKITGFFDTHYQSNEITTTGQYRGCWSVYVDLPSKNIIAVDMQNGLFMLDAKNAYEKTSNSRTVNKSHYSMYPNPVSQELFINIDHLEVPQRHHISITNTLGQVVSTHIVNTNEVTYTLDVHNIPAGSYIVTISSAQGKWSEKLIKL